MLSQKNIFLEQAQGIFRASSVRVLNLGLKYIEFPVFFTTKGIFKFAPIDCLSGNIEYTNCIDHIIFPHFINHI